jgi:hypothetical protein
MGVQTLQITRSLSGRVLVRRQPPAATQIDLSDPVQIAHWCREFGVTWLELVNAVEKAGPQAAAVGNALRVD